MIERQTQADKIDVWQEAAEMELQVAGAVPWSLEGAYVSVSALARTARGAELIVRSIDVSKRRRIAYHAGRITITSDALGERLAAEEDVANEPVQLVRSGARLLLNIPAYGVLTLSPEVSRAAVTHRVARTERSLLAVGGPRGEPTQHLRGVAARSELTCWYANWERPRGYALDGSAAPIRALGIDRSYLVATRTRESGGPSCQLGVADLETADFTWYPIELEREHRLLAVRCRERSLTVWIAEALERSARIRALSIDVAAGSLRPEVGFQLDAHGPFGLEPPGAEPLYAYGVRAADAGNGPALLSLQLRNGAISLAQLAFGYELGPPVVAGESGGQRSWLLVTTHDSVRDRVELSFREGRDFAHEPVAIVQLPSGFEVGSDSVWI